MILKGSNKYPVPKDIDEFFKRNNGECTAYSSWTSTNFHFKVDNIVFEEALDIFSNFFVSPTFPESEAPRVIRGIHHQFKEAMFSDFWHHTNLYMQMANNKSPLNRFIFGNREILSKPEARF